MRHLAFVFVLGLIGCSETTGTGGNGGGGAGGAPEYAWGLAQRITPEVSNSHSLAVNVAGFALVAWDPESALSVTGYDPGSGWSTPERIEGGGLGSATPEVALAPDGTAVLVWQEFANPEEIRASHYTPSGGWTAAVRISPQTAGSGSQGSAYAPQVVMDGNGDAIAAWQQLDPDGNWVVLAARFTPTGQWEQAQSIDSGTAGYESRPQVTMDPGGNAVAVWHGDDSQGGRIFASSYTPRDGWADAQRINSPTDVGTARGPDVAMDAGGNAIAVWVQADYEDDVWTDRVWSNRFTQEGGWGTAESFETTDTSYPEDPQVSMNTDGAAVAIWQRVQTGPERYTIWSARYGPARGWEPQAQVDADRGDQDYGYDPQVAVDPVGDALAVWQASSRVWSAVGEPEEGWGPSVRLDSDDAAQDAAEAPLIGVDGAGRGIAVWYEAGGGLWANRYGDESMAVAGSNALE